MLRLLFRLITSQPQLLADHLEAYAELVGDEVGAAAVHLKRRVMLQILGVICAALAIVFAGMALMLWGALPTEGMRAPWLLILVPALPAVAALASFTAAKAGPPEGAFANVRRQFAADAAMLREANQP